MITKDDIRILLAKQRQDVRVGVLSAAEAAELLGICKKEFNALMRDPDTKLIPSRKKGKYIFRSVVNEFGRIHGTPYKEAILI